ncbi:MAG TPA: SDR family NAD(P)-dependent oxidoreductase [Kofleriaceae bacterium]
MKSVILVCGHGPGISDAVARKFGGAGHSVALVARNADRVHAAATTLGAAGIDAKGFACDLSHPAAVEELVTNVKKELGPIAVVHYNAYGGGGFDLLSATPDELRGAFDVSVTGLVTVVRAARTDLEAAKGAVLVTGGGFAFYEPKIDAMAVQFKSAGVALGKAAQHKTVGLLSAALKPAGVYVGEVVVMGVVKGTAFDQGNSGTLEPGAIADKFYEMAQQRGELTTNFG